MIREVRVIRQVLTILSLQRSNSPPMALMPSSPSRLRRTSSRRAGLGGGGGGGGDSTPAG